MVNVAPRRQFLYSWYSDQDPQTPNDGHLHAQKTSSSGFPAPVTIGGSRLIVVGDHNAFTGDWSVKHGRENGCPQHVMHIPWYAVTTNNPSDLRPYFEQYRAAFDLDA